MAVASNDLDFVLPDRCMQTIGANVPLGAASSNYTLYFTVPFENGLSKTREALVRTFNERDSFAEVRGVVGTVVDSTFVGRALATMQCLAPQGQQLLMACRR
jgi:hypothetical protein